MDDNDWIFELLSELGDASEEIGLKRLTRLLELCMDVYVEEERLVRDASLMFRSNRKNPDTSHSNKRTDRRNKRPAPSTWLKHLDRRVLTISK